MAYESPVDFLKTLTDDEDKKKIITLLSKGMEFEDILKHLLEISEVEGE